MAVEFVDVVSGGTNPRPDPVEPLLSIAPTVTAFLGRTERGPVNEPVELRSFDEYRRAFGGYCAFSYVPHVVQYYFQNGGEHAVVVRLTHRAVRAAVDVPAGDQRLRLQARRPGSRELLRVSVDYDRVEHDAERFNLVVQRLARPGSQLIDDQELFPAVSVSSTDPRFIVDALKSSELVSVLGPLPSRRPDATVAAHPGQPIPYIELTRRGTDGDDLTPYDIVGSNEEGTGLFALDTIERIDLMCIPPAPARDVATTAFLAASRYCERRRAMLIWDPPWSWQESADALRGIRSAELASRNALIYFPRIRPRAEFAHFPEGLPASGALAGMLSRTDAQGLSGGPAPDPALLRASLTTAADVGDRHMSMLNRYGVNTLVRTQGGHVELRGNACLAPPGRIGTASQRLDTRRAELYMLGALERGTRWVCRDVAGNDVCDRLTDAVTRFLEKMRELGLLRGARAEQSFLVRVVRSTDGSEPEIVLRTGLALLRPGELAIYELRFRANGTETRVVSALDAV